MSFDDPIYLDLDAFEEFVSDTDQHRICWMYHDALSNPKIAWMFDRYAGTGTPIREAWTTMAWVAAGRLENSCYILFKWYADFSSPPERGDLYYIEQDQGMDKELRVRLVNTEPILHQLGRRGQAMWENFLGKISDNASSFFGESDFEASPIGRILRLADDNPGQELEAFDWYLGRRNDWDKAAQCATISAYFSALRSIQEIIYNIVVTDGGENAVHHMHTTDLLGILKHLTNGPIDIKRLGELAGIFQELSEAFCLDPHRSHLLDRTVGRGLSQWSSDGTVRWVRLGGQGSQKLLRELYCRCDPRRVWDVFHRCQADIYYTVFRRPPGRGLRRGVYIISRFEDQRGMDITDLFWLENLTGGVVHLCGGEFFDELLDQLLSKISREVVLHGGRRRSEDLAATYASLLKDAFDKLERGPGHFRSSEREKIF